MIIPRSREDRGRQRTLALAGTAASIAGLYLVLIAVAVPEITSSRRQFREVDLTRFVRVVQPPEFDEAADDAEEPERPESTQPAEAAVTSVERVDVSDVLPEDVDLSESVSSAPEPRRREEASGGSPRVRTEDLTDAGGFESLDEVGGLSLPSGRRGGNGAAGGIALEERREPGADAPSGSGFGAGSELVGESRARGSRAGEEDVDVDEFSPSGGDYESLDVMALIEWMKKHPSELPIGIKQHVQFRENYLSSVVQVRADDRAYELYLMCNEALREVHIVLVDGRQSTYLIDRSFEKNSSYLREGFVTRDDDAIIAVDSRQQATGTRAERFYSIFLSWWDTAREDVR